MYMAGLLLFPAYKKWPHLANTSKWVGMPLMSTGLIAASFANNVNTLIITQGAIYAIGGSIIYFPVMLFVDEWFVQRKGLAFGVLWVRLSFDQPSLSNHPQGRNRGSRPHNPLPPQLSPREMGLPNHPPHLGRNNPYPLNAPPLLSTSTTPHLICLPLPPLRP
jgi:hypothetical protein